MANGHKITPLQMPFEIIAFVCEWNVDALAHVTQHNRLQIQLNHMLNGEPFRFMEKLNQF